MTKSRFFLISVLTCLIVSGMVLVAPIRESISAKPGFLQLSASPVMGVQFLGESPAWAKDAEATMRELEAWRGLKFKQPLTIEIKPREAGEPAGWYVPATKQLIVTSDGSESFRRGVMLHEIFHALQDQNFDLSALRQSIQSKDASQALDALIEGEAMLAVSDRLNYDFTAHAKLPDAGLISDELFNRLFEYGDGMSFVRAIRAEGWWDKVNQTFENIPTSTTEIYHPDRYLSRLASQETSPDAQSSFGEYGFRLWLARSPETRSLLAQLDEAYQSDRLQVLDTGEQVWQIDFKTENWAKTIHDKAPDAMRAMPQSPSQFTVTQDKTRVTVSWQNSSSQTQ